MAKVVFVCISQDMTVTPLVTIGYTAVCVKTHQEVTQRAEVNDVIPGIRRERS